MTSPSPNPVSSMKAEVTRKEVWTVSVENSPIPMVMRAVPTIGKILYRPIRAMIWPLPIEAVNKPAMMGNSMSPEVVGDTPRTTWRYTGR